MLHLEIQSFIPARHVLPPESLIARQSTDVLAGDDAQLAQAIRFVREHACDPISVADVLRIIPLSRSTLENRFRASLGRALHAQRSSQSRSSRPGSCWSTPTC